MGKKNEKKYNGDRDRRLYNMIPFECFKRSSTFPINFITKAMKS